MAQHLSMNPDTFVQGGLLNDVDVEVVGAKFAMYDYGGSSAESPCLILNMKSLDGDGEETEQVWSVGSAKDFEPSDDGEYIVPTGTATSFRKSSNFSHFIASLVAASYPKDKLDAPVSSFVGLRMHVIRKPAPEREGLQQEKKQGDRTPTILLCARIIRLPWEAKGGKGATGKSTASSSASSKATESNKSGGGAEASDEVKAALNDLLMEHAADGAQVSDLKKAILKLKQPSTVKQQLVKALDDADLLGSLDPAWTRDGSEIKPAD